MHKWKMPEDKLICGKNASKSSFLQKTGG